MGEGGDRGLRDLARIQALEAEVRTLRAAETRMRAVFDQTYQLIGLLSLDGILLEANLRALDFSGTARDDVVGRPFPETPWWSHAPELQERVREAIVAARGGALVRFEATHIAAGGAVHTIDFSIKPLVAPGGAITHLVCEGRDISGRKAIEESLRASRKMLALVLDTIPVRVFWKDLDLRYLGCNMQFARDAGLTSPDAIVGRTDLELSWRAEAERYRRDDAAVIASGVPRIAYDEPQTSPDGAELWLRTSKIPLRDAEERIVGVLGVYEDITARKKTENERLALAIQVQRAQKLESLGVLAGGIAHDFNNLLTVVLGSVDLLRLAGAPSVDGPSVDAPSVDAGLRAITGAAHRASHLCRQLLAYSGRGRFMVQPVDVNVLVRDTADLFRAPLSNEARLEVVTTPEPLVVEADATQIRQLLMNLLTNAKEALSDQSGAITGTITGLITGLITIRTSRAAFAEGELHDEYARERMPAGTYAVLEVHDTGVGLDEGMRARIFEPFFTTKFTGPPCSASCEATAASCRSRARRAPAHPSASSSRRMAKACAPRRPIAPPRSCPAGEGRGPSSSSTTRPRSATSAPRSSATSASTSRSRRTVGTAWSASPASATPASSST
jgi:two-component system cell cycle sensor histidine kinase/response regulator CckA